MAELIIMPKLGFNMSNGKLVKWYKSEGQEIKKGEAFFSIETDKTNMDIEATGDGFVKKLLINEGDQVEVTRPIAVVGGKDEDVKALIADALAQLGKDTEPSTKAEAADAENTTPEAVNASQDSDNDLGLIKITPRARKAAKEKNIDVSSLNMIGTGYQEGICEADILAFADSNKVRISTLAGKIAAEEGIDVSTLKGTSARNKIMKKDVEDAVASKAAKIDEAVTIEEKETQLSPDGKEILEILPYSGVRRVIGDRLSESKVAAPHVYFTRSVDLTNLLQLRKQVNTAQKNKTSVTDYIALAVTKTLQKFPDVNVSLQGEQIIKYKTVNLGLAVAAESGLIVPNIKDAENRDLLSISNEASRLIEKARKGKLSPEEYTGGTFTISNLGMFGIENFTAIINPPESAILAVSATEKKPVVMTNDNGEDEIIIKPMMNITLSVDHRVIDGLLAAQFVGEVKKYLESPVTLLL